MVGNYEANFHLENVFKDYNFTTYIPNVNV